MTDTMNPSLYDQIDAAEKRKKDAWTQFDALEQEAERKKTEAKEAHTAAKAELDNIISKIMWQRNPRLVTEVREATAEREKAVNTLTRLNHMDVDKATRDAHLARMNPIRDKERELKQRLQEFANTLEDDRIMQARARVDAAADHSRVVNEWFTAKLHDAKTKFDDATRTLQELYNQRHELLAREEEVIHEVALENAAHLRTLKQRYASYLPNFVAEAIYRTATLTAVTQSEVERQFDLIASVAKLAFDCDPDYDYDDSDTEF